jgi:hypothetical protein
VWYAKEKAEVEGAREVGALDEVGQGERRMIEGVQGGQEEYAGLMGQQFQQQPQQQQQEQGGGGILSSSTLAALKGFKATAAPQRAAPLGGPLVGYGSDDDSD